MSHRKPGARTTKKSASIPRAKAKSVSRAKAKPKAEPKARAKAKSAFRAKPKAKAVVRDGDELAQDLCQHILSGENVAEAEVSLAFAEDETLRKLNAKYRDMDRTTDVLAFTYDDEEDEDGNRILSGDVIVSVPRVLAQAKRYKVTPGRELARLITHGFLHLCGHDHKKVGERKLMRAREKVHMDALKPPDETALTNLVESWSAELD